MKETVEREKGPGVEAQNEGIRATVERDGEAGAGAEIEVENEAEAKTEMTIEEIEMTAKETTVGAQAEARDGGEAGARNEGETPELRRMPSWTGA